MTPRVKSMRQSGTPLTCTSHGAPYLSSAVIPNPRAPLRRRAGDADLPDYGLRQMNPLLTTRPGLTIVSTPTTHSRFDMSHHSSPTADEPDQQQYQSNDQQHVDGSANRVGTDEPKQPGNQQNNRQDEQHVSLPGQGRSRERAGFGNGSAGVHRS